MGLIAYEDAIAILTRETTPLVGTERVALDASSGRVLAEDVAAPFALPPFASSAMDGYALFADATKGASAERPVSFEIAGRLYAGDAPRIDRRDAAYEISTGAPLPKGLDAVIRREDATLSKDGARLMITAPIAKMNDARAAGEDFAEGESVVRRGTLVSPAVILPLAALGVKEARVFARPRVVVVTTGNELLRAGTSRRAGAIYDCNGPTLVAMLRLAGCDVRLVDCVPDDLEAARSAMHGLDADLILTVGAVSEGERDFVPALAETLGARPLFHKVAIRPAKPVFAAKLGPALWLGLPGNPVSAVVGARFFAFPVLRRLLGMAPERPLMLPLAATQATKAPLLHFLRARVELGTGVVAVLGRQASHLTSTVQSAGTWAVCDGQKRYDAGERVPTFPLFSFGQGGGT